jgi:hypothetical protein
VSATAAPAKLLGAVVIPEPTGPEAPEEVAMRVVQVLNFAWFAALACCFLMAIWGAGSLAYASKKQHFGGVNEGKKLVALAIGGAVLLTMLRGLFRFFGGV